MGWGFGGFWRVEGVDMRICWGFCGKDNGGDLWRLGGRQFGRSALRAPLRPSAERKRPADASIMARVNAGPSGIEG